jgi:hypothetical protein
MPDVKRTTPTDEKNIGEGGEGTSSGSLPYSSNDSYSSSMPHTFLPHDNSSPYPPSSRSSSDDHSIGSKRIVNEHRSQSASAASPTQAALYSEIQALKYDAEKSKTRIKVLDEMSESMRTDLAHARGMLAEHGDVLGTLVAQRAKMVSEENVQKAGGGGPLGQ